MAKLVQYSVTKRIDYMQPESTILFSNCDNNLCSSHELLYKRNFRIPSC